MEHHFNVDVAREVDETCDMVARGEIEVSDAD